MYKIIGGDQIEYGPVTFDQLRQWILEGRVNHETKTQTAGSEEWKTLSSFPEFAEALAAQAVRATAQPPLIPENNVAPTFSDYATRAEMLDIGSCITRGWNLLSSHFILMVGASALVLLINVGLAFIPLVGQVASAVLGMVLWAGLDWLTLKLARGQSANFADAFAGFQINFSQLILASIVTTVLITLGLLLCILPGIYLMVAWMLFTPLLIMDKSLDFWSGLELSRKLVTRNWWIIFALFILTVLMLIGGLVLLGIGIFVTLPLATATIVYAYEDIFGIRIPQRT